MSTGYAAFAISRQPPPMPARRTAIIPTIAAQPCLPHGDALNSFLKGDDGDAFMDWIHCLGASLRKRSVLYAADQTYNTRYSSATSAVQSNAIRSTSEAAMSSLINQLAYRAAFVSLLISHGIVLAVTPLTPSLTEPTRTELLELLRQADFPEVGQNSVQIAITSVLGFSPKSNAYQYDEPYVQLPKVSASARASSLECAVVSATAHYSHPERRLRVRIDGTYCLVSPAQWKASRQTLVRELP